MSTVVKKLAELEQEILGLNSRWESGVGGHSRKECVISEEFESLLEEEEGVWTWTICCSHYPHDGIV